MITPYLPFLQPNANVLGRDKADAEQAIATMNGEWLGSRAIRVNWANQKTQTGTTTGGPPIGGGRPGIGGGLSYGGGASPMSGPPSQPAYPGPSPVHYGGAATPQPSYGAPHAPVSYDSITSQSSDGNSTVYVGNLIPYTTQADLIPLFQGYGYIVEIRMQADRGFAFVKLDSHHNAAMAISQLQNRMVHGRPIKCSWGKDKDAGAAPQAAQQYPMVGHAITTNSSQ